MITSQEVTDDKGRKHTLHGIRFTRCCGHVYEIRPSFGSRAAAEYHEAWLRRNSLCDAVTGFLRVPDLDGGPAAMLPERCLVAEVVE